MGLDMYLEARKYVGKIDSKATTEIYTILFVGSVRCV